MTILRFQRFFFSLFVFLIQSKRGNLIIAVMIVDPFPTLLPTACKPTVMVWCQCKGKYWQAKATLTCIVIKPCNFPITGHNLHVSFCNLFVAAWHKINYYKYTVDILSPLTWNPRDFKMWPGSRKLTFIFIWVIKSDHALHYMIEIRVYQILDKL